MTRQVHHLRLVGTPGTCNDPAGSQGVVLTDTAAYLIWSVIFNFPVLGPLSSSPGRNSIEFAAGIVQEIVEYEPDNYLGCRKIMF